MAGSEIAQKFFDPILNHLHYFADPSKRIYYGCLLSAMLMAALFALWNRHQKLDKGLENGLEKRGLLHFVFPWRLLLHRSSRLDFKLFFANGLVRAFLIAPWVLTVSAVGLAVFTLGHHLFGTDPLGQRGPGAWSPLAVAITFTVVTFALEDFSRFFVHYIQHRIPFLWEFHKVHHSATVLTPMTFFRVHPVEMLISMLRNSLVIGFTTGLFIFLFGNKLSGIDVLGVDAFGLAFNFLGANLRHSHVFMSFGRLEHFVMSPAQHQIHHSSNPKHFDKNFGICFSAWDKLFGSFYLVRGHENLRFGVREEGLNPASIRHAYFRPIALAAAGLTARLKGGVVSPSSDFEPQTRQPSEPWTVAGLQQAPIGPSRG